MRSDVMKLRLAEKSKDFQMTTIDIIDKKEQTRYMTVIILYKIVSYILPYIW